MARVSPLHVMSQGSMRRSAATRVELLLFMLACTAVVQPAGAQGAGRAGWRFEPSISLGETLTDHSRDNGGDGGWESISTVTPRVRLSSPVGRLRGSVDYSLVGVLYARDSQSNDLRHRLNAALTADTSDGHFRVDVAGSITREPISALGQQSPDEGLSTGNFSDVTSFSVSPVVRGTLFGLIEASARLRASATDSGTNQISDSTRVAAELHVGSTAELSHRIGWSLDASREQVDFDASPTVESDRLLGTVIFVPDPELRLQIRGGTEESNIKSLDLKRRYDNYGAGLLWQPGPRTRLSIDADRRAFGDSHAVSVEHRMRRTVLRYSDGRSLTDGSQRTGIPNVTAYDLFFTLFASQEPDPIRRDILVREFLDRNGVDPGLLLNAGFLTSSSALQRRQEFALAYSGQRTSVVATVFATQSERVDRLVGVPDELAVDRIRQRGLSVTITHRLTPISTLGVMASIQRSDGDVTNRSNELRSLTATWAGQTGPRSNMSLGVRHTEFTSDAAGDDYAENAVLANFLMRF